MRRPEPLDHVLVVWDAALRVLDRRRQHLARRPRAVPLHHGEEGVDDARHGEGEVGLVSRPCGDRVQPLRGVEVDRRRGGRSALAAQRHHLAGGDVVEHEDPFSREGVVGEGLDDRGGEDRRGQRVEGVSAVQQQAHARHRRQVVAAGDHALGGRYDRARPRPERQMLAVRGCLSGLDHCASSVRIPAAAGRPRGGRARTPPTRPAPSPRRPLFR